MKTKKRLGTDVFLNTFFLQNTSGGCFCIMFYTTELSVFLICLKSYFLVSFVRLHQKWSFPLWISSECAAWMSQPFNKTVINFVPIKWWSSWKKTTKLLINGHRDVFYVFFHHLILTETHFAWKETNQTNNLRISQEAWKK